MKLGKRTATLLREAMVLAYVEGTRWGRYHDDDRDEEFPRDSEIVRTVLISATRVADLYPTLARLNVAQNADAEHRRAFAEALMAEIAATAPSPGQAPGESPAPVPTQDGEGQ